MINFFWMPVQVWYFVIIPIIVILLTYFFFWVFYKNKKGDYYYNYVVDYVYSTLGIVFCGLLFCLLLGYSIATIQIILEANLLKKYLFLVIVLGLLPIVPSCFLVYVLKVYINNLKRKEILDNNLKSADKNYSNTEVFASNHEEIDEYNDTNKETNHFEESDFELKKKNRS